MKRLLVCAALALLAVPATAQVDKKVEKELQASYAKLVKAIKKRDAKAAFAMMTPDATITEMGETKTRKEFEPEITRLIKNMELHSAKITFTKLTAKDGLARAEYTETMKGKMRGQTGVWQKMESIGNYRATFKKMKGEWKMKTSETLGIPDIKIDGQPMRMPGAP